MYNKENIKLIDFTALGIDTKLFSPAANYFRKHGAYPDFNDKEYWDEEEKRCQEGYSVIGTRGITLSITAEHYIYLNYTNIKLTEDEDKDKERKKNYFFTKVVDRTDDFPYFYDADYIFYWCKYIARYGASNHPDIKKQGGLTLEEFNNLHFPDEVRIRGYEVEDNGKKYIIYGSGKNLVVGKARRKGYSYKMGTSGSRRYHFSKKKKTITLLCAYDNAYLLDDALMTKTAECIDWIDGTTPFRKRRLINTDDHKECGYKENIGGTEVPRGKQNQVMAISFRSNKGAARGKGADEIYVDEAGKAPNLLEFIAATIDSLGQGIFSAGQLVIFGTGGGDNTDWEGFRDIFFDPTKHNCLEFENVWDKNALGTYCGFFVPDYWALDGFISPNGESLIELAREFEEEYQKNKYIDKKDVKGLIDRRMEHPFCPSDAFAVSSMNIFDVAAIREWRHHLETTGKYKSIADIGWLSRDHDGILKFKIDNEAQPLWDYPIKKGTSTEGAIVKYFGPVKINGRVPDNLYIINVDTYRHAETTGDSVGSVRVKIRSTNLVPNNLDNRCVAVYTARPKEHEAFLRNIFFLAEYYNAKIGFENDEPGGIIDYGKRFRLLHYLQPQFELAYDENIKTKSSMKRVYGMHMGSGQNNERKDTGDGYIKSWLEEIRGHGENGEVYTNLHTEYDIGYLKELEMYNLLKGNFDRISSSRVEQYHGRELVYKNLQVKQESRAINRIMSRSCFQ